MEGFKVGSRISFESQRKLRDSDNLKSAKENLDFLKQKFQIDINNHRVSGQFREIIFQNFQSSPLGLIPKKSGETIVDYDIVIHNLFYSEDSSVSDGIHGEFRLVQYQEIEDAVVLMRKYGENCRLFKIDIPNAYKLVPIH